MKKLIIPKIQADTQNLEAIAQQLGKFTAHPIDTINWKDTYPSKPITSFRIAHDGNHIFLQYQVEENEILAAITEDNGEVWTDSCVEFFISFDQKKHYYNLETSCIGKALLGYRESRDKAEKATLETLRLVKRLSSLGTANRTKQAGKFNWQLTLIIPRTIFWKSDIQSFDGLSANANFYKCGDNLTIPHFVSWAPINTPNPDFHQPSFFGELLFEK